MASVTLHDLLQPQVILDVVSRLRKPRGRLGQFFGFHATERSFDRENMSLRGPNTSEVPTRFGAYRIYDETRTSTRGRAPGTGPATYQVNPVGQVDYACLRLHEKIRLLAEDLGNLARIFGPNSIIDEGGQEYVGMQIQTMTQRIANAIELVTWGMTRNSLYLVNSGENWIPQLTVPSAGTAYFQMNFQIPAGNLSKLNMLGTGDIIAVSWDNPAAPILTDLLQIDTAFVQLTGDSLKHVWISNADWINIISNTQVKAAAGTAATPFQSYERVKEKGFEGEEISEYTAILRGAPQFLFHIINDVLVVDGGTDPSYASGTGTLGQAIPDGHALFSPEPEKSWVDFLCCPEMVSEQPGQPMVKRTGYYFWKEWITQPSAVELISLFNGIPRLKRPKSLAYGNIVF